MKQSLFSRRSCSVGASSVLAVAVVGLAATPAFAGTPHHAGLVHGQQNSRALSAPANVRPTTTSGWKLKMRSDPRMSFKMRSDPRMSFTMRPDPRMSFKMRSDPRMS